MRLKDKIALVTGAGSGNGAAIALEYLKQGAKVVFSDINEDAARAIALESGFSEEYWHVSYIDVSKRNSVKECVKKTLERFGRLDILVANAGIIVRKHFLEMTDEEFDSVMNVNSKGIFMCSQEAAKVMAEQGGGVIIHMSSISSKIVAQYNSVAYGASKGAVASMTRHMALDLSDKNIRVNAIAPGTILTNLTKQRLEIPEAMERQSKKIMLGRIGTPDELVGAAVFLASDESSFMTGTEIVIDGGETAQ